jgi:hypothetical protein
VDQITSPTSVYPLHVTFTGADEHTSELGMQVLASDYPIEWGILFSPKRQGAGRYPPLAFVKNLLALRRLRFAAHLCGDYAEEWLDTGGVKALGDVLPYFPRIQINTARPDIDTAKLAAWATEQGRRIILQCRSCFPADGKVTWLFDASGGRGISPAAWPAPPSRETVVGYAGGLNPSNVAAALAQIAEQARLFYLDMESGVRDEHDRFSLDRCREVLHAVYGSEPHTSRHRDAGRTDASPGDETLPAIAGMRGDALARH